MREMRAPEGPSPPERAPTEKYGGGPESGQPCVAGHHTGEQSKGQGTRVQLGADRYRLLVQHTVRLAAALIALLGGMLRDRSMAASTNLEEDPGKESGHRVLLAFAT